MSVPYPFMPNVQVLDDDLGSGLEKYEIGRKISICDSEITILECLSFSCKSSVFTGKYAKADVIVKFHQYEDSYLREIFAYTLLGGIGVPRLLLKDDNKYALVIPKYENQASLKTKCDLSKIVKHLSLTHEALSMSVNTLKMDSIIAFQLNKVNPSSDNEAFVFKTLKKIHADCHIPIAITDCKIEHFFLHNDELKRIDLETLAFGTWEGIDLISLINLVQADGLSIYSHINEIIYLYLKMRERIESNEENVNLYKAMMDAYCMHFSGKRLHQVWS